MDSQLNLRALDRSVSLGQLGLGVLDILMQQNLLNLKWKDPLSRRFRWVAGFEWTLEECASLVGVTRERMRQVQKSFVVSPIELPVPPRLVFGVLQRAAKAKTIEEFWNDLKASGLAGEEEDWNAEALLELFSLVADQVSIDALGSNFRRLSPPPRSRRVDSLLREARTNLLGIMRLPSLVELTDLDVADLITVIRRIYKHVFVADGVALAVQRPPGTFVSVIAKQLLVDPVASPEDLFTGLERVMSYRRIPDTVSFEEFSALLALLFGEPASVAGLPQALSSGLELAPYEQAWVGAFASKQRRTLHRDELIDAAARTGISAISAGVYLSTSPIIRPSPVKRGYFQLV
jgi:hypothetical protein